MGRHLHEEVKVIVKALIFLTSLEIFRFWSKGWNVVSETTKKKAITEYTNSSGSTVVCAAVFPCHFLEDDIINQ